MEIEGIPIAEFFPYMQAAAKLPGRRVGKTLNKRTIERWRHGGILKNNVRIRLRAVRLFGTDWYTCDRWLETFLSALSEPDEPVADNEVPPRTPTQRERASRDARRRLDELMGSRKR
jgi:hypothetical protein